jgi:hypothetical protein
MSGKSAPGSSTPTSRPTDVFSLPRLRGRVWVGALAILAITLAALYVVVAFVAPNPLLRIVLRCLPVLPVAIWTLWFDRSRPFEGQPAAIRNGGRMALLVLVMAFTAALLGIGLNWLYDPNRVI